MHFLARQDTKGELIADGIVHIIGVIASLIAAAILIYLSTSVLADVKAPPLIIYSLGLIATFVFSAAYNLTRHPATKAILRRFDHSAIFIMIAGTYTPLALIAIGGGWGNFLAITVWAIAIVGVFFKLIKPNYSTRIYLPLYLAQGWLAIIAIKPVYQSLTPFAFWMILGGGIIYSLGTVFHHYENWRFSRAVWHSFVLTAASIHYAAVIDIAI